MRFRKGSNVEVLKKSEGPSGSWWCAEIIKGNGRYYHVKYNRSPDGTLLERVPRKAMRPLPPIGTTENWILGNIVEVFDNNSWKIAKVSKVVGDHYFLVRLLGSCQEFRVHKTNLRVRQSWQNNQWIMIGKLSQNSGDENPGKPSSTKYCHESSLQLPLPGMKVKAHVQEEGFPVKGNCAVMVEADIPGISFRRSMKRGPQLSSLIEPSLPKVRVIHKDGLKLEAFTPCFQSPKDDTWGLSPSHEGSGKYLHPDSLQISQFISCNWYYYCFVSQFSGKLR